jgi:hypothetical protein
MPADVIASWCSGAMSWICWQGEHRMAKRDGGLSPKTERFASPYVAGTAAADQTSRRPRGRANQFDPHVQRREQRDGSGETGNTTTLQFARLIS